MSKELLDTLPLEEVKKRTVLQQQVSTGTHASNRTPDYLFSLRRSRRLQRLKSLGASMKNEQIRINNCNVQIRRTEKTKEFIEWHSA